jgi:hypothetical protein
MSNQLDNSREHLIDMSIFPYIKKNRNNKKKDAFLDAYIAKLFIPYIIYLKIVLSDDEIYKNLKKNIKKKDFNMINLYFLMEIIKKNICN